MGSSDDDDEPPVVDIQAHIRPLLKKLKKQEARIDKLDAKIKENEKRDRDAVESQRAAERSSAEVQASLAVLKDRLESGPWREDNDKLRQELVGHSTRLQEALEEQRVQLNAHAQVFQSTQTSVVQQQHDIAAMQAETSEARRRGEGDLASLSTRVDQLRSETSERDTSNFTEATQHADRLAQRLQQDVLRLEQQLALCAQSRHVSEQVSSLQQEAQSLSAALEEAKRTARASAQQLQEARDQQSGYALQSSVSTMQQLLTTRLGQLEEGLSRVDASQHAVHAPPPHTRARAHTHARDSQRPSAGRLASAHSLSPSLSLCSLASQSLLLTRATPNRRRRACWPRVASTRGSSCSSSGRCASRGSRSSSSCSSRRSSSSSRSGRSRCDDRRMRLLTPHTPS